MLVFHSGVLEKDRPCSVCRTPTRDSRAIIGYDGDFEEYRYDQLCRRCLEAEKAFCRTVFIFTGEHVSEIFTNHGRLFPRPGKRKKRVA